MLFCSLFTSVLTVSQQYFFNIFSINPTSKVLSAQIKLTVFVSERKLFVSLFTRFSNLSKRLWLITGTIKGKAMESTYAIRSIDFGISMDLIVVWKRFEKVLLVLSQHVCEASGQRLPRQKTFEARLLKTETLQTLKLYIYMLINSLHFKSCKRYVVFMYRSIIFTSCKKYVFYTYNSSVLIQIGTEQLWNKRIFIFFPTVYLYHYQVLFLSLI